MISVQNINATFFFFSKTCSNVICEGTVKRWRWMKTGIQTMVHGSEWIKYVRIENIYVDSTFGHPFSITLIIGSLFWTSTMVTCHRDPIYSPWNLFSVPALDCTLILFSLSKALIFSYAFKFWIGNLRPLNVSYFGNKYT